MMHRPTENSGLNTSTNGPSQAERIVSLLPAASEILALLGFGDRLVGRSHECDHPSSLGRVPMLTRPRPLGASPVEIDRAVRESSADARALFDLDAEALAGLKPDLIITQDLCHVCSVDLVAVRRVAAKLSTVPAILSLNPTTLEGVLDDVLRVGDAVGVSDAAAKAVVALRERLFAAGEYVNPFDEGPSVAFIEWTEPLYVGGHWIPQMIERAGGRHPLNPTVAKDDAGGAIGPQMAERVAGKSFVVTAEAFGESEPAWVIAAPCGVPLPEAVHMTRALARHDWFRATPAYRASRVVVVDGNQMFARPGPRLVDAFEFLVGLINDRPELIPRGFPWARLDTE
jgi:ABC-type Fe3+-hydroxamate transport system substrate-binding protein